MEQQCKECEETKDLSEFYSHPLWVNWVLSRCKECIKKWRRSERERKMARVNDNKRAKNPERKKYSISKTRSYRMKNPEKYKAHRLVTNFFKKNPEKKIKICTNCWWEWQIELHHEDYNKPYCVIPLCSLCHKWYHKWSIEINKQTEIELKPD